MKKIEFVLPDGGHSLPDYSLVEPYDNSEFEKGVSYTYGQREIIVATAIEAFSLAYQR